MIFIKLMSFDWAGFQSYLTTIGSVLGLFSFVILIYRLSHERPILKFYVERCYHVYTEEYGNSSIHTHISIDNIGDRSSSVKEVKLIKMTPEEYMEKIDTRFDDVRNPIHVPPRSSIKFNWLINFPNFLLKDDEVKLEFDIIHTHNKKRMEATSKLLRHKK